MKQVQAHIQAMGETLRNVAVVGYDRFDLDKVFNWISNKYSNLNVSKIHLVGNGQIEECVIEAGDGIVLISDHEKDNVIRAHSVTKMVKKRGVIVASCNCNERSLFYESPVNTGGLTYQGEFFRVGCMAAEVGGDYLEFGVFDGRTMSLAYHSMKNVQDMRFFGFDSFSGIIGRMDGENKAFAEGEYYSNIESFWHNMATANVNLERLIAVKANFIDELSNQAPEIRELKIRRAAVIHIDCDVYMAAKAALNFCRDMVCQGTVLLLDEFHANCASNDSGERRALREWLNENPHIEAERWHDYAAMSRSYILHVSKSINDGESI